MDHEQFMLNLEPLINRDVDLNEFESVEYLKFVEQFCSAKIAIENFNKYILLEYSTEIDSISIKRQWIIEATVDNLFDQRPVKLIETNFQYLGKYTCEPLKAKTNTRDQVRAAELWVPKESTKEVFL